MMLFEKLELLTFTKIVALPAALDFILTTALSYLAFWRPAVTSARLFTTHFSHRAQQVITLLIVLEFLEEGNLR